MGAIKNMVIDRGVDETRLFLLDQDVAWTIENLRQLADDNKIPDYKKFEALKRIADAAYGLAKKLTK